MKNTKEVISNNCKGCSKECAPVTQVIIESRDLHIYLPELDDNWYDYVCNYTKNILYGMSHTDALAKVRDTIELPEETTSAQFDIHLNRIVSLLNPEMLSVAAKLFTQDFYTDLIKTTEPEVKLTSISTTATLICLL